jgi:hypothetical protein
MPGPGLMPVSKDVLALSASELRFGFCCCCCCCRCDAWFWSQLELDMTDPPSFVFGLLCALFLLPEPPKLLPDEDCC